MSRRDDDLLRRLAEAARKQNSIAQRLREEASAYRAEQEEILRMVKRTLDTEARSAEVRARHEASAAEIRASVLKHVALPPAPLAAPTPTTVSAPIRAASDDGAIFELLASVGCRMPKEAA